MYEYDEVEHGYNSGNDDYLSHVFLQLNEYNVTHEVSNDSSDAYGGKGCYNGVTYFF